MTLYIVYMIGILYAFIYIKFSIGIPCIFHEITGLYCPGCGATRATISLIKLDFYQAFRYNIIVVISIPLFIVYLLYKNKTKKEIPNTILYIYLAALLIFGILRNIPYFSFLAPIEVL